MTVVHDAEQGRGLRVTRSVVRGELLSISHAEAVHGSKTESVRLGPRAPVRGASSQNLSVAKV